MSKVRPLKPTTVLALSTWSLALRWVVFPIACLASKLLPKLQSQLQNRMPQSPTRDQATPPKVAFFFCASAGEYEQALPLIQRLQKEHGFFIHVFFASYSGVRYVQARPEQISWQIAPLDCFRYWRAIFAHWQPEYTFVVRHEFWPSFLATAWQHSRVVLIDASQSQNGRVYRFFMRRMLKWFDLIYCIESSDQTFFASLAASEARVFKTGDTKYDRSFERALQQQEKANDQVNLLPFADTRRRLIIGSAWPEDIAVVLAALRRYSPAQQAGWLVVIVPHEIDAPMIRRIEEQIASCSLTFVTASNLKEKVPATTNTFIVDQIGKLAELYGCCDLAVVGGAMHHQVHNVLEPASYGLPIAFGPNYHSQREARQFVASGLARVFRNDQELFAWWQTHHSEQQPEKKVSQNFLTMLGASQNIVKDLEQVYSWQKSN